MLKITMGKPASVASAKDSCISESPCPVDPVAARAPVLSAPQHMPTASSSLSAFTQTPPTSGRRSAKCSSNSVNGVIGYPAKNRHPAAIAASAIASDPSISRRPLNGSLRIGHRVVELDRLLVPEHGEHPVGTDHLTALASRAARMQ